jgi:large subunit ribosomal protein L28
VERAAKRPAMWTALDPGGGYSLYARLPRRTASSGAHPRFALKVFAMSRRCALTGVGPMVGHNVSHSNIKTKRRFLPSLADTSLQSEALGQSFRLKVSNAALRTLDFRGGLDAMLLKASDEDLSPRARKIKRQVKAKLAAQAQA